LKKNFLRTSLFECF